MIFFTNNTIYLNSMNLFNTQNCNYFCILYSCDIEFIYFICCELVYLLVTHHSSFQITFVNSISIVFKYHSSQWAITPVTQHWTSLFLPKQFVSVSIVILRYVPETVYFFSQSLSCIEIVTHKTTQYLCSLTISGS